MKKYVTPEMEISELELLEIVTTSGVEIPDYEGNKNADSELGW